MILLAPRRSEPKPEENQVDVTFRAAPKPAPVPPPSIPEGMKVKRVKTVRPPTALVEPTLLSKKKLEEADPSKDQPEVGEGGGGDVGGGGTGTAPAPAPAPPPPPPPPPKKHVEAIQLPEEAVAPVPDSANAVPDYPAAARSAGQEGLVILKIVVTATGEVTHVEVLRGDEPFVTAAVNAVKSWRYTPALVDGRAAAVYRIVKVPFRLRG